MKKELKKALYLDDKRVPLKSIPGYEDWVIVKNYDEFKEYIENNGIPDYISLAHDLADEHVQDFVKYQSQGIMAINYGDYKEKTGLHCLRWLCEYVEENHEKYKAFFNSFFFLNLKNEKRIKESFIFRR